MRGSGESRRALTSMTDVTVMVENVDEPGMITLNWLEPEVGTVIMATLTDPDGVHDLTDDVANQDVTEGWTWQLSTVTGPLESVNGHWGPVTGDCADRRRQSQFIYPRR